MQRSDWISVPLDPATRMPALDPQEIVLMVQDGCSVMTEAKEEIFGPGVLRLTTHCFLWIDPTYTSASALPHARVSAVEEHTSGVIQRKSQIRVHLLQPPNAMLRVEFRSHGRDKALAHWSDSLRRKLWETKAKPVQEFSAANAGIGGIMRKVEEQARTDAASLDSAFADLDALVKAADDLVKIAQKLKAQQERVAARSKQSDGEAGEVADLLLDMGLVTPITKANAGSLFHEELARSICGWLAGPIGSKVCPGGMVTLPDVYCAYNRARGTDLISPEDLLRAVMLMADLGLPMRLRDFPSGVRVLESVTRSEERSTKAVLAIVEAASAIRGADAALVADRLGIALSLASEELLRAEDEGLLCRDDSIEGLFFFVNAYWKAASA